MSSLPFISTERRIAHTFFLLSVWSKGVAGVAEAIGGLLLLYISDYIEQACPFFDRRRLAENPFNEQKVYGSERQGLAPHQHLAPIP